MTISQVAIMPAAVNDPALIAVSSQLMQNYRLATPLVAGSQIGIAFNPGTDQSDVFSIGSDGHIYYVHADPGSDTGWRKDDLDFPGSAKYVAAGTTAAGVIALYAVGTDDGLYFNLLSASWSGWQLAPWPSVFKCEFGPPVPDPAPVVKTIRGLKLFNYDSMQSGGWSSDPYPGLLCLVQDQQSSGEGRNILFVPQYPGNSVSSQGVSLNPTPYPHASGSPGFWMPVNPESQITDSSPASIQWGGGQGLNGGFLAGLLQDPVDSVYFSGHRPPLEGIQAWRFENQNTPAVCRIAGNYRAIATISLNFGGSYDEAFAVSDADQCVYRFVTSTSGMSAQKISDGTPVSQLAPHFGSDGWLNVFALGVDQCLYHVRQNPEPSTPAWTEFACLNQTLKFSQIVAGANRSLYSEAFALTADNRLFHVWQSALDSEWKFDEVELVKTGALELISAYGIQLKIFDTQHVPAANATVTLISDAALRLEINGVSSFVDHNRPWSGKTNVAGEVSLVLPTDSLGVPLIHLTTPFLPAGKAIEIDASATVRASLTEIDEPAYQTALKAAKVTANDGTQSDLLDAQAKDDVASLASSVKSVMDLASSVPRAPSSSADLVHFHRINDHRVARCVSRDPSLAQTAVSTLASTPATDACWQIDFSGTRPVFTRLTHLQIQQVLASSQALPSLASNPELDSDWGSVFDYIGSGVAKLLDIGIAGLKATMRLVVKGVTYVFEALIGCAEQALDLLEEVFVQFRVQFDKLFRYLGYIFNWADIHRSQLAIEHSFEQGLLFARGAILKLRDVAAPNGPIDAFKLKLDKQFDDFISSVLPPQYRTIGDVRLTETLAPQSAEAQFYQCAGTNVVMQGVQNNSAAYNQPLLFANAVRGADAHGALQDLTDALTRAGEGFKASDAFTQASNYFLQIGKSPDQFLQLAIAGIAKVVEGIADFALGVAQSLLKMICDALLAVLDALNEVLQAPLPYIPMVSDLYASITLDPATGKGETLSFLALSALTLAVPATALHKILVSKRSFPCNDPTAAPFPDQASLDQFRSQFTAQNLLQSAGLLPSNSSAGAGTLVGSTPEHFFKLFFRSVYTANSFYYIFIDVGLDAGPSSNSVDWQDYESLLNKFALAHTIADWIFSIPWVAGDGGGIGCEEAQEFGNLVWILQVTGVALDSLAFWKFGTVTRGAMGKAGPFVATLWGGINLVLAIVASVKDGGKDRVGSAAAVLGSLPGAFKLITAIPMNTPPGVIANVALWGLDVVCDTAAFGLNMSAVTNTTEASRVRSSSTQSIQ